ncbi:MAG: DUF5674 family protein [Chloroflexota bacterium]
MLVLPRRWHPVVHVIREPILTATLDEMSQRMFGNLVKAVVDVEQGIMAIDAEMHADEEALLLSEGSRQGDLWGINLYPKDFGTPEFIEFDSVINIRPSQGNRTRSVEDPDVRARIAAIVNRLVAR